MKDFTGQDLIVVRSTSPPQRCADVSSRTPGFVPLTQYHDADVRVVVGETYFDVHRVIISHASEYFRALFNGPWTPMYPKKPLAALTDEEVVQDPLPVVTPGVTTVDEFKIFVNFAYSKLTGDEFVVTPKNIIKVDIVSKALGVDKMVELCTPGSPGIDDIVTWENVEDLLEAATEREFPAESYHIPELVEPDVYSQLPEDPWKDPFFHMLSAEFRVQLLQARVQEMSKWKTARSQNWQERQARPPPKRFHRPCTSTTIAETARRNQL
ncbi:hypothetical protein HKX48_007673 [Thoreauomyces humboldtii]|nr:hypothetical protein HKX48_007673 [Thoreauomyces humboldtii]